MLSIDIIHESPLWDAEPGVDALLEKAVGTAAAAVSTDPAAAVSTSAAELAIVLSDDSQIRRLNSEWRGIDKPTNVLSFPSPDAVAGGPRLLGDIVIAYETTAREATDEDKPFAHHLSHLAVHGFLHLVGYDHENDADAERMEACERTILAQLGVPDPYRGDERMSDR